MFVMSFSKRHRVIYGAKSQAGSRQARGLAAQTTSIPKSGNLPSSLLGPRHPVPIREVMSSGWHASHPHISTDQRPLCASQAGGAAGRTGPGLPPRCSQAVLTQSYPSVK